MFKALFIFLLILFPVYGNSGKNLTIGGFEKNAGRSQNGFNFHPRLLELKGFKRTIGYEVSLTIQKKNESDNFNLFYANPALNADKSFKVGYIEAEYENRNYMTPQMFSRCRLGMRNFNPNSEFENFYRAKGQNLYEGWKPYVSFGIGYRTETLIPGLNMEPVFSLDYIVGDDYRFPSENPAGNRKIPAKGFRTGISLRF
jgi:hypothetical protein